METKFVAGEFLDLLQDIPPVPKNFAMKFGEQWGREHTETLFQRMAHDREYLLLLIWESIAPKTIDFSNMGCLFSRYTCFKFFDRCGISMWRSSQLMGIPQNEIVNYFPIMDLRHVFGLNVAKNLFEQLKKRFNQNFDLQTYSDLCAQYAKDNESTRRTLFNRDISKPIQKRNFLHFHKGRDLAYSQKNRCTFKYAPINTESGPGPSSGVSPVSKTAKNLAQEMSPVNKKLIKVEPCPLTNRKRALSFADQSAADHAPARCSPSPPLLEPEGAVRCRLGRPPKNEVVDETPPFLEKETRKAGRPPKSSSLKVHLLRKNRLHRFQMAKNRLNRLKLENNRLKFQKNHQKIVQIAPKIDKTSPKIDKTPPKIDKSAPKIDKTPPKIDRNPYETRSHEKLAEEPLKNDHVTQNSPEKPPLRRSGRAIKAKKPLYESPLEDFEDGEDDDDMAIINFKTNSQQKIDNRPTKKRKLDENSAQNRSEPVIKDEPVSDSELLTPENERNLAEKSSKIGSKFSGNRQKSKNLSKIRKNFDDRDEISRKISRLAEELGFQNENPACQSTPRPDSDSTNQIQPAIEAVQTDQSEESVPKVPTNEIKAEVPEEAEPEEKEGGEFLDNFDSDLFEIPAFSGEDLTYFSKEDDRYVVYALTFACCERNLHRMNRIKTVLEEELKQLSPIENGPRDSTQSNSIDDDSGSEEIDTKSNVKIESDEKIDQSDSKIDQSDSKTSESDLKTSETDSKIDETDSKIDESDSKIEELSPKIVETEPKIVETESKVVNNCSNFDQNDEKNDVIDEKIDTQSSFDQSETSTNQTNALLIDKLRQLMAFFVPKSSKFTTDQLRTMDVEQLLAINLNDFAKSCENEFARLIEESKKTIRAKYEIQLKRSTNLLMKLIKTYQPENRSINENSPMLSIERSVLAHLNNFKLKQQENLVDPDSHVTPGQQQQHDSEGSNVVTEELVIQDDEIVEI